MLLELQRIRLVGDAEEVEDRADLLAPCRDELLVDDLERPHAVLRQQLVPPALAGVDAEEVALDALVVEGELGGVRVVARGPPPPPGRGAGSLRPFSVGPLARRFKSLSFRANADDGEFRSAEEANRKD